MLCTLIAEAYQRQNNPRYGTVTEIYNETTYTSYSKYYQG